MNKQPSVLFVGRDNIFGLPGEDTKFLLHIKSELKKLGWHVGYSCLPKPWKSYDVIHLLGCVERFALEAVLTNKPYVLSPFYKGRGEENIKNRLNTKILVDHYLFGHELNDFILKRYANCGKNKQVPNHSICMKFAEKIIATHELETAAVKRDFPLAVANTLTVNLPIISEHSSSRNKLLELRKRFGFGEYMLSIGEIGPKGNQLMLLHALKDESMPLIIVDQAIKDDAYLNTCKKVQRKGLTIFTGPLSDEDQAGLLANTAVCIQPGYQDSSGIELADAYWMCPRLVISNLPILSRNLCKDIFLCAPGQADSILLAVQKALASLPKVTAADKYTGTNWPSVALKFDQIYREVIAKTANAQDRAPQQSEAKAHWALAEFRAGAAAAILTQHQDTSQLAEYLEGLLKHLPNDLELRYYHALAHMMLNRLSTTQADLAYIIDKKPDCRLIIYLTLGLCYLFNNEKAKALEVLEQGVALNPFLSHQTVDLIRGYINRGLTFSGESALLMELRQIIVAGHDFKIGSDLQ